MDDRTLEEMVALLRRTAVLEACRDGPASRRTIAERADCSRSTAYRATSELTEEKLLERTNGGYRLTGSGAAALDHIRRFTDKLDGTDRIRPLFEYVDDPAFVRRAEFFTDAELVAQEASSPYHVENRMKTLIEGTEERMIGMTTGLGSPALAQAMFERIRAGVCVEWMLPAEPYEYFNAEHGALSAYGLEEDQTAVYVRTEPPVDLAIYDDTLVVFGFDRDRGVLDVVAITEDGSAIRWAREKFEEYRSDAERVE